MTAFRSIGAALETDGSGTEPKDVRKDLTGLFANPGVIPGGDAPLVTGTSGAFSYQVGRCNLVSSRGVSDGYHLWGNDGTVTLTTADDGSSLNAPGSGSRIDIVYGLHPSNGENADTTSQPYFAVRKGAAAPSPSAPSLPTGALELARNTMTAGATSTGSSGNAITQTPVRAWSAMAPAGVPAPTATASNGSATVGSSTIRDDVLGVYRFVAVAGRQYRAACDGLMMNGSVANDVFEVKLSYAQGTAAPGVSDPAAAKIRSIPPGAGSSGRVPVPLSGVFSPSAGVVTIAVLVTRLAGSGAGTPVSEGPRQLYVQDMGPIAPAPAV